MASFSTERPGTTFADVAGYAGVKQDIKEVVDFLKTPERFAEIGDRAKIIVREDRMASMQQRAAQQRHQRQGQADPQSFAAK